MVDVVPGRGMEDVDRPADVETFAQPARARGPRVELQPVIKSRGIRLLRGLIGDGLFVSEGDLWLRQRRLMQPAFHRQRVAGYGEVMAAYAAQRAAGWRDGAVIDIHEEMMAVTRAIVAKTLFDADVSDEARALGDASHVVMEYFGKRPTS